jgi:hypothetical protein
VSAAFHFDGEAFWGTNGSVEAYLESLRDSAERTYGPSDPVAVFFRNARDGFFGGNVVYLDECLVDEGACRRFVRILDEATAELLGNNAFTDLGRNWVATVIAELRQKVVEASLRPCPPSRE